MSIISERAAAASGGSYGTAAGKGDSCYLLVHAEDRRGGCGSYALLSPLVLAQRPLMRWWGAAWGKQNVSEWLSTKVVDRPIVVPRTASVHCAPGTGMLIVQRAGHQATLCG